jgi:hypothetical protein
MSRSRRTTAIAGNTCASSEKCDKRVASRRSRRVNREILKGFGDDSLLKDRRETGDPWLMSKDGKQFFSPENHPDLMRK